MQKVKVKGQWSTVFRQGQVMVESIVALSILVLGTAGIFTLLSSSLRENRISTERYVATYLAEEGVEIIKSILDKNTMTSGTAWNSGVADGIYEVDFSNVVLSPSLNRLLKFDSIETTYNYAQGNDTKYKRDINIQTDADGEGIVIASTVSWGGGKSVALKDHVFNWR